MLIIINDWEFSVDLDATTAHTTKNASDHCLCAYCKNYYETLPRIYPAVIDFLASFGVDPNGPSELMPFEPTLMLACYRVKGQIHRWGSEPLQVAGISILPEMADASSFFLWVGETELPWIQNESVEDVVSPANLPEFMERMRDIWLLRHGDEFIFS